MNAVKGPCTEYSRGHPPLARRWAIMISSAFRLTVSCACVCARACASACASARANAYANANANAYCMPSKPHGWNRTAQRTLGCNLI